jgi:hypothetical protein
MKIITGIVFALLSFYAIAAELPSSSPTGIYSDFKYNTEGGDLLGAEVFLVRGTKGYFVIFQSAQGIPSDPVVVVATVKDGKLTFQLPKNESDYSGLFEATIYRDRLEGGFLDGQLTPDGKKRFILRKKKSYWQQ